MSEEKAIKGTVTISLEDFEELKSRAKRAEGSEARLAAVVGEVMEVYGFDDEAYNARLKEIDEDKTLNTDKKIWKALEEAMCLLNITVNTDALKQLFRKYIDSKWSENHADLKRAGEKQLKAMKIILQGQQEECERPDMQLCMICEEYMEGQDCEHLEDASCPAAAVIQKLKQTREQLESANKEIKCLKNQIGDLKNKMSYMRDPMAIGDRHEMGG